VLKFGSIADLILERLYLKLARLQGKGWDGGLEREVSQALRLLKLSPKLCIDIGGHEGRYSEELLLRSRTSTVVIFEPSSTNAKKLKDKFGPMKNVVIEGFALSDQNGETSLFSDRQSSPLASLTKRNLQHLGMSFDEVEVVEMRRFEDYWFHNLRQAEIDICKLDIEGHELSALKGFGQALQHIKIIQFEFGGTNLDSRTNFKDFWQFFETHDFELYRMSPLGPRRIHAYSESHEMFVFTNFLARRRTYSRNNMAFL